MNKGALILLLGVFISSISQVLLKKAAMTQHDSLIKEYLNIRVIGAYGLFLGATLLSLMGYKYVPLSMGPVLEATGYIYVTVFGVLIFHERMNRKKLLSLILIIAGILIFSAG